MKSKERSCQTSIPFLLPIRCILFLVMFFIISILSKSQYTDISKWWTSIAIICNIITIIILYLFSRRKEIVYLKLINYKNKMKET